MNTYLFYDLETTGLNKAFDQVVQFASIRTDMMFNEIERHNILIRVRPDVIYSPYALITNRISISESMKGICEYEAIKTIHGLMNEFGTISLGYNTLGFDDEFLRFSFYRNLLPPYTHQYDKGCYRMDLLPITVLYSLYKKNLLKWPDHNGKPSMKLEYISSENQLAHGRAHDAMVDVEATVELTRRLSREKEMWEYLSDYFIKKIDANRINKLPESFKSESGIHRLGIMTGSEFGPDLNYQVPVLSIGNSIPYNNQTLWLRLDLPELQNSTLESIHDTTWVFRKRLGEPGIILPPLERYWSLIGRERSEIVERNADWFITHGDLFQAIIKHYQGYTYPDVPNIDPDASLYQVGFLPAHEQKLCNEFHNAPFEKKLEMTNNFSIPEVRTLAKRLLFRNYSNHLNGSLGKEQKHHMLSINPKNSEDAPIDYKGEKRLVASEVLLSINNMRKDNELDEVQIQLLNELEQYFSHHFT